MPLPFSFAAGVDLPLVAQSSYVGPFQHTNGDLYVVLEDSGGGINMFRSTDGGNSWTAQNTANRPAAGIYSGGSYVFSAAQGSGVLMVGFGSSSGGGLRCAQFSMATNTWAAEIASGAFLTASNHPTGTPAVYTAGPKNTNDFIYVYSGTQERIMGTDYYRVYAERSDGDLNSFSSIGMINTAGGQIHYRPVGALGIGDRVHVFYMGGSSTLYHRCITSTNTLGTEQLVDGTVQSVGHIPVGIPFAKGTEIILPIIDSGGELKVWRATSADAPTWSLQTVTPTTVTDPEIPGSGAADGNTVHVFWADDTTQDIFRDSDGGTGTWGTDTEWKDAVNVDAIHAGKITNAIGIIYRDGGTVKYDAYSLGGGGAALAAEIAGTSYGTATRIQVGHALAAAGNGTSQGTATSLRVGHALEAYGLGSSQATADLTIPPDQLAAEATGTSYGTADALSVGHTLAAETTGTSYGTATGISMAQPLAAEATGTSQATATEITVGHALAATEAGTSYGTADRLEVGHALAGETTGTSQGTADRLEVGHALEAYGIGASQGTGNLTIPSAPNEHPLEAEVTGTSYGTAGDLTVGHPLAAAETGTSYATATEITAGHALAAEGTGTSQGTADRIEVGHALVAAATGTSQGTGDLTVESQPQEHPLEATATGTSYGTATRLEVGHILAAAATGSSYGTATGIRLSHAMEAESIGTSQATADRITAGHALAAAGDGTSYGTAGILAVGHPLEAYGIGTSQAEAALVPPPDEYGGFLATASIEETLAAIATIERTFAATPALEATLDATPAIR